MKIPDWAEKVLDNAKPKPPKWATDGQVNAVEQELWLTYTNRFRHRWHEINSEKWKVPPGKDRAYHSYLILTAAVECARRLGKGANPQKVVEARKALLIVDDQISKLAGTLAKLFQQRDQLHNDYGVGNWRKDEFDLDPIDLWDALELCFNGQAGHPDSPFLGNSEIGASILHQLNLARRTSGPVPEWSDLLEVLSERFEPGSCAGDFPDITVEAGDTNKSKYSPWCNSMIRMLHSLDLLNSLTHEQLASLASVAFDAPDEAINAKQIGALKAEQVRRLNSS
jgi:hypothetical protein